jgi:hypothetical protein
MRKATTSHARSIDSGGALPRALIRTAIAVGLVLLVYLFFLGAELARYHAIPTPKKDLRLRQEILARFPSGYDVSIRTADLLGLGDRFYVAGGNSSFVAHAYTLDPDFEKNFDANKGRVNFPMLKIFYVKEPGLLSALFAVLPFFDVERQFAEISLSQYYDLEPLPIDAPGNPTQGEVRAKYSQEFRFPSTFSLLKYDVFDADSDGQDEIATQWLSYAGGSGGGKWSIILDFIDGKLTAFPGYPDFLNIDFSRSLWALLRYSGTLDPKWKDMEELTKLFPILEELGLTDKERETLFYEKASVEDIDNIVEHLHSNAKLLPNKFMNFADGTTLDLVSRHTDDYSQFIKVGDSYLFADAFYIDDSACHWCGHRWRILSYLYRDGRWISDRVVNGDRFDGQWLAKGAEYDLNQVFGTYPDQGPPGLAFSFINSDWTMTSKEHRSDPFGVEMRLTSPVDKQIRQSHRNEAGD